MNLIKFSLSTLALSTLLFASSYKIDSKTSSADFSMKYSKSNDFKIEFKTVGGEFIYDEKKLILNSFKSEIDLEDFVTSKDELRTLVEDKIFNIKKFPKIKFVATQIEEDRIIGDLTINNVTKNIEFDLENSGEFFGKLYLKLSTKIKRAYFDLTWDELLDTGSSNFDNEIDVEINIEANKINNLPFSKVIEKNKK